MKFVIGFIITAILLSGCASKRSIDPALQPTVDKFMYEASLMSVSVEAVRTDNLIVEFREDEFFDSGIIGWCENGTNAEYRVSLKRSIFMALPPYTQEQLVYHELGHCLLDRKHRNDLDPVTQLPVSIMNADLFLKDESKRAYYMAELFSHLNDWNQ